MGIVNCYRICRPAGRVLACLALLTLLLGTTSSNVHAQQIVQDYYVPMPEAQIRTSFLTLAPATGATMDSVVSMVVAVAGTKVYYDHWEDGYEVDLNSPVQATTQVWGDGNNANGIAPGFANDPASLAYGAVMVLRNNVPLPRVASVILYDGRDHVAATRGIVMSRSAWATSPGSVLADATEVSPRIDWGTSYVIPIGQNVVVPTPSTSSMFELTSLLVMAGSNGTTVQVDADGNGTVDVTTTINQGESYQLPSGVTAGATVTASKPVQVQLLTGDIGANYESRWYTIPPLEQWTSEYYSPVGTASNGESTYLFLYNKESAPITINYQTGTGTGTFPVPAKSVYQFLAPQNSATRFTSAGGQSFYAVGAVGASLTSNNVHDWGFDLVPTSNLTTELVVGWGPGSVDGTQNGSPVWVTPLASTTIYVDYNGDHVGALTDAKGGKYDVALSASALQVNRVFDPDRDQTGMRLYTLNGTMITGAWGQDPATAGPGTPYLDAGTTVPNFPVPVIIKSSKIDTDVAPAGLSIGDTLLYTITIKNQGLVAMGNVLAFDPLPLPLSYVPNTTILDGSPLADSGITPYPLDEAGYTIPIIPRRGASVFTYKTTVILSGTILNSALAAGTESSVVDNVPPGGSSVTCVIDFTGSSVPPSIPTSTTISAGTALYVQVNDADANTNASTAQSFPVSVSDSGSGDVETVTLTETGANTGIFRSVSPGLATSSTLGLSPGDGTLHVVSGDTLVTTYVDPLYGDNCSDSSSVTASSVTKILYLDTDGSDGDSVGDLDRVDPVNTSDASTSSTATLSSPSAGAITISGDATKGKTGSNAISGISQSSDPGTTITFSHSTGTGTNRLLLVGVALECSGTCGNSASPTIGAVTFNGTTNLTRLGRKFENGKDAQVEIWYAFNPPANTTGNIVVTQASTTVTMDMVAGAVTFAGVNTSQTLSFVSQMGNSTTIQNPSTNNPSGNVFFDTIAMDEHGTLSALTSPRALLWNHALTGTQQGTEIQGASSWTTTSGNLTEAWTTTNTTDWAAAGVTIAPAAGGSGGAATFTQTPALCENLELPAGSVITSQVYYSTISGTMAASPSVSAVLKYGSTTVATSTGASSNGSKLTFTFPALGSLTTIPSGAALQLVVTNNDSAVTFKIQYDSSTKPSFVGLPTSTVIHIESVRVYDAAYAGGSVVPSASNGQTLYVRTLVGDPFGSADINGISPLTVDGPGAIDDLSTSLGAGNVVDTGTCTKTYEYVWDTGGTQGTYAIAATAREGFENTVTDSKSTSINLNFVDLGTPCSNELTSGSNGATTITYATSDQVCVRVSDLDQNTSAVVAETVGASISTNNGDTETLTLTETGLNAGVFAGCRPSSPTVVGSSGNGTVYAPLGTVISTSYVDPTDSTDLCSGGAVIPSSAPAVAVSKVLLTPSDGQIVVGEEAQFRIRVSNTGNTTLSTVALGDLFPAAKLAFVAATPAVTSSGSGTLSWTNVGPLTSGQSVDILVSFTGTASAVSAVNTATVDAGGGITASSSADVLVTSPSLSVTKLLVSPATGPASKGDNVVFSITVYNSGDTTIDSLPLEDTYSGSCFDYVSATPAPDSTGYGSIVWSDLTGGESMTSGGTTSLTVTLKARGGCSPATNTAAADFVTDVHGDAVSPSSDTASLTLLAGAISGFVYEDEGAVGFGGDVVLDDVTVSLYTDPNGDGDPSDGTLVGVTTSGPDGSYDFLNLAAGNYVVVETDLLGYDSISDTEGSVTDNRIAVNVTSLVVYPDNNFLDDFIDVSTYGSIAGQVREDTDGDGDFDDADSGVVGVTIDLYTDPNGDGDDSDGVLFLSTMTDGSGNYTFPSLPPGNYVVVEANSAGYVSTADVAGANDDKIPVVLPGNGVITGRSFLDTMPDPCVVDADCDDGIFCNGAERCVALACAAGSDPCPAGDVCGSVCNEAADNCFLISGTVCRASSGVCDVAETCTGSTALCPTDGFASVSTICRAAVSACDVAETCSGADAACPSDALARPGLGCDDGLFCSDSDVCSSGVCSGSARVCSDSDLCTVDACDETADACTHVPTSDPTCGILEADLSIVKEDLSSPVQIGAFASYSLTVSNAGPNSATAVQVLDQLDSNTTWITATRPCSEGPTGTLTCELGDLASGGSVTFEVVVHIEAGTSTASGLAGTVCSGGEDLCNRATVQSLVDDPNLSDNSAEVTTDVVPVTTTSELTMTKSDLEAEPILFGNNVTYRIEIANSGPDTAADVVVHEDLDPAMSYVSDTAGCTLTDPGTNGGGPRLYCSLGDIAPGESSSFDVVVTILSSAATTGTLEDGDCGVGADVCNDAVVTTASADFVLADNRDREPTDTAPPLTCGNGVVDPGEQCDTPNAEICNNGIDDDGDTLIDCAEPACAVPDYHSCSASCRLEAPCNRIRKDPAHITWRKIQIHGNFVPTADVDPVREGFLFVVSNASGEIYRGRLLPGDMKRTKVPKGVAHWQYKDAAARSGSRVRDGLYRVGIHKRYEKLGEVVYVFRIAALGDMSKATLAEMTTQVYIGNEVGYATAVWDGKPGNWKLSLARFEAQSPQ